MLVWMKPAFGVAVVLIVIDESFCMGKGDLSHRCPFQMIRKHLSAGHDTTLGRLATNFVCLSLFHVLAALARV